MTTTERSSTSTIDWTTRSVSVCGGSVSVLSGGHGAPLLVLPRDNGHPPNHDFLDLLAARSTVYYPWLPGFHASNPEEWEWLTNFRDLAIVTRQLLVALGVDRVNVVGLGFGGWLAAEMATMGHDLFATMTLVAPMGIQPRHDYILDQFLISTESYARAAFANDEAFEAIYGAEPDFDQLESWETDREMTSRVTWKPYMYNPTLARLLAAAPTPTLIVWGSADRVVPPECAELYRSALPNAKLQLFPNAGHALDLEQPAALAASVAAHLNAVRA
jgi:pimeloyl-ACP methyl ester carboxylesterase